MKIYVAGSSDQLERVEDMMNTLETLGFTITHDWTTSVRLVGKANPPDASLYARLKWGRDDLAGVSDADVLVLLMPLEGGFGAAVELGYAIAKGIPVYAAGVCSRSIFTAFGQCFDHDDQLVDYFKEQLKCDE